MTTRGEATRLALMEKDISYIRTNVDTLNKTVAEGYVTRKEFQLEVDPLKKIVYGMVTLVLVSVVGAAVALVIRTN